MIKKKNTETLYFRGRYYDPSLFANRDLSWWQFNERVLNEALDDRTALLERFKFIDIYRSNSDEFFMKRTGHLIDRIEAEDLKPLLDGLTARDLFDRINTHYHELNVKLFTVFQRKLMPQLKRKGIALLRWKDLKPKEKRILSQEFKNNIFPILTPLAVDQGHPFPFLSNLSKSIGVCLRRPRSKKKGFARVKIPTEIPQWIKIQGTREHPDRFVYLDDIISEHLDLLFPGMKIEGTMTFRVIRDAIFEDDDDDDTDDIMEFVEEGIRERKFAPVVRLEYDSTGHPWILKFLKEELLLHELHCHAVVSFLTRANFSSLYALHRDELKEPIHRPKTMPQLDFDEKGIDIFDHLKKDDQLAHFPYQSYRSSVESFLNAAVADPKVRAIKIVLYRTDDDGRLVNLLIKAAELKKQVAVVVELKARFDEEKNIKWANALEKAGIHVSYGLVGVKTHAKLILVVRQETKGLVSYGHVGTGNFNSKTARLYTDLSLFTANKAICSDIGQVFNYLTGVAVTPKFQKLLVAPFTMAKKFLSLIEQEIVNVKKGRPAGIIAKMNSLEDPEIITALYKASNAGVPIQLIVRGFCCLKPHVKGQSETIKVFSLVGRFLEHHRIYYFRNGQKEPEKGEFYQGSADWMYRNLHERVEVITPILSPKLKRRIYRLLAYTLKDNRHLWELNSRGVYIQRRPKAINLTFDAQDFFIYNVQK
jgi:polyphosphate kinase